MDLDQKHYLSSLHLWLFGSFMAYKIFWIWEPGIFVIDFLYFERLGIQSHTSSKFFSLQHLLYTIPHAISWTSCRQPYGVEKKNFIFV